MEKVPKTCPVCKGRGAFAVKPLKKDSEKGYKNRVIVCDSCDGKGILGLKTLKLPGT